MRKRKSLLACVMLTAGLAVLSAGAAANAAIVQHTGANDPTTEGWAYNTNGSGVTVGALTNDAGSGKDAWYVNDASTSDYGLHYQDFSASQQTQLLNSNWTATAVLRMPDLDMGHVAIIIDVNLGAGNNRFLAYFGTDASGNPGVYDNDGIALATTSVGAGYHTYDFHYDKTSETVDISVDGTQVVSDWSGLGGNTTNGRLQFGSGSGGGTGQGNFNLVEIAVPEPACLGMVGAGMLLMLRRRKQVA